MAVRCNYRRRGERGTVCGRARRVPCATCHAPCHRVSALRERVLLCHRASAHERATPWVCEASGARETLSTLPIASELALTRPTSPFCRMAQLSRIWATHALAGEVVRERVIRDRVIREGYY